MYITAQGPVSEMTYTVPSGTLNSSIPCHTIDHKGLVLVLPAGTREKLHQKSSALHVATYDHPRTQKHHNTICRSCRKIRAWYLAMDGKSARVLVKINTGDSGNNLRLLDLGTVAADR